MISNRRQIRARIFPDLQRTRSFGREIGFEPAIHFLDVGVDHAGLILRHGKASLDWIDGELLGSGIDRLAGPAVEHGIFADRQCELPAELFEGLGSVMALNWAARPIARKPRSGSRTMTSAAAIPTAPMISAADSVSR